MTTSPMYSPNSAMGSVHATPPLSNAAMEAVLRRTPPYMTLKGMIFMRMRIAEGSAPFDFLEVHEGSNEVFVFAVVNGKPITLSDEKTLFPTDQLITKLNLLRK